MSKGKYYKVEQVCTCGHPRSEHAPSGVCRHWGCRCARFIKSALLTHRALVDTLSALQRIGGKKWQ